MRIKMEEMGVVSASSLRFLRTISLGMGDTSFLKYNRRNFDFHEISELFHENTKLRRIKDWESRISVGIFQRPEFVKAISKIFPSYPTVSKIHLPTERLEIKARLDETIAKRRSIRSFSGVPITLKELSTLLYFSYGITGYLDFYERETREKLRQFLRAVPSGGGLYPLELYLGVLNVQDLDRGLYYYNVREHALEVLNIKDPSFSDKFLAAFPVYPEIAELEKSAAIFVIAAVFWRQKAKYGPRGYRFALQESGHLAQNLHLIATSLNLGSVALAGFYDDEVNEILGIDGVDEAVVYAVAVGKPREVPPFEKVSAGELRGKLG